MGSLAEPYYDDGWVRIYHAKCEDVLPHLSDNAVDLVCTDPPYEAEAHGARRRVTKGQIEKSALPFGQMTEPLREFFCRETIRICSGWAITFCQAEAIGRYRQVYGPCYRRPLLWYKPDAPPQISGDRPSMAFESMALAHHTAYDPAAEEDYDLMVASWQGAGRSAWNAGGKRGVYIHTCTDYPHVHPTQKSLPLIKELLRDFAPSEGATVGDWFAGAGTTGVAAKMLGMKAILVEMSEEWCDYAATWLEGVEPGSTVLRSKNGAKQLGLGEVVWG